MRYCLRFVLIASLIVGACGGGGDAGNLAPTVQPSGGTYVHAGSGMEFPEQINSFVRSDVAKYDDEGNDIGVDYPNSTGIATSVYIFPSHSTTADGSPPEESAFKAVKTDVEDAYDDEALIEEDQVPLPGRAESIGWRATYSRGQLVGETEVALLSDAYLFGFDDWLVEYRFTYPEASVNSAQSDIRLFMELLKWPEY
jgi:hypothetical protein